MYQLDLISECLIEVETVDHGDFTKTLSFCINVALTTIQIVDDVLVDIRATQENVDEVVPLHFWLGGIQLAFVVLDDYFEAVIGIDTARILPVPQFNFARFRLKVHKRGMVRY